MVYFHAIKKLLSFNDSFINKLFNVVWLDNINFENANDCFAKRNNWTYKFMVFNSLKSCSNTSEYIGYENCL